MSNSEQFYKGQNQIDPNSKAFVISALSLPVLEKELNMDFYIESYKARKDETYKIPIEEKFPASIADAAKLVFKHVKDDKTYTAFVERALEIQKEVDKLESSHSRYDIGDSNIRTLQKLRRLSYTGFHEQFSGLQNLDISFEDFRAEVSNCMIATNEYLEHKTPIPETRLKTLQSIDPALAKVIGLNK